MSYPRVLFVSGSIAGTILAVAGCGNGESEKPTVIAVSAELDDPSNDTPSNDALDRLSYIDLSDPNEMLRVCFDDYGVPYERGGEVDGDLGTVFSDLEPAQQAEADLCSDAVEAAVIAGNENAEEGLQSSETVSPEITKASFEARVDHLEACMVDAGYTVSVDRSDDEMLAEFTFEEDAQDMDQQFAECEDEAQEVELATEQELLDSPG